MFVKSSNSNLDKKSSSFNWPIGKFLNKYNTIYREKYHKNTKKLSSAKSQNVVIQLFFVPTDFFLTFS